MEFINQQLNPHSRELPFLLRLNAAASGRLTIEPGTVARAFEFRPQAAAMAVKAECACAGTYTNCEPLAFV